MSGEYIGDGDRSYSEGEGCSIEYLRDLCESIRVTVGIYRIVDIRHCDSSCMDGKHPYEVIE